MMRIFHKLFLGFSLITVLVWVVGFFAIQTFQTTREKTVAGYGASIARMILQDIDREIYEDFVKLKVRSKGDTLQRTLEASNKVFEGMADREATINRADREWLATPEDRVTPFMKQILDLPLSRSFQQEQIFYRERFGHPLFPELFVTNRFGVLAGASNKTSDYRQNDEAWWKEAWEKGFFFGPVEYDQSSKAQAIAIAARVENDRHEPVGVFKGVLNMEEIDAQLKASEKELLFHSGHLFLLGPNGRYLFPKDKFGEEAEPFLKDFLASSRLHGASVCRVLKNKEGDPRFFALVHSSGYEEYSGGGKVLLVSYDEREIFEPVRKARSFVFFVAGIATALSFLAGLFLAISFSRPLEKLRQAADRFGEGDLTTKTGIVSNDEFGKLALDFEMMAESLRKKTTSIETLDREIEERRLLEKVSLENALFLQKLMDSIPSPVFYKDISGVYIGCNKAFEVFFGIPQKELMGKKVEELFSPELARIYREKDEELFALPGIQVFEASVTNASGEPRSIVFQKATFVGPSGEVQGIIGVIMDITLRKRAEEALLESEKRFMDVLYASRDAILLIDGETFVDCNEATARMLGYRTRAEFLKKHPSELSPPVQPDGRKSFEKANEMMKLAFEHGFHRFEWMHRKAHGEEFSVEVSLTPVVIHGKNILHCLWRDMTELKKIESQVRQLSQAMEQSPSCAVITDKNGRIEYVNQRFVELTGYSRDEAVGQNPRILKSGEQSPEFYKELWDTILAGKDWQGQFCNKKKNGELYWELAHIAPLRDQQGNITHFVAVKEDITYRRQMEAELRHSLRMEAVGRLAGGIAHDFNNMLTVINGYSGYLLGKMKPEDPSYDKVREIRDAGDCAATIVRQLLNLSRKEAPKPQLIRVDEAAEKMARMINRLIGEGIEFRADHAVGADFVKMDPGQMEQVLLNLLVNARESMTTEGVLTLATDTVRIEEIHEELMPERKRTGDFVRITVKDTGAGIDPVLRKRIFEPFFTTKKKGMNTGLGLSIVYGIVEQAGGAMSLESQLGKGTTFRVYLPRVCEDVTSGERTNTKELPQGRGKILLVEDEAQVREFALQVLRERGYDVRAVRGGEEALAMLEEDPGRKFDLLLTDLTMPKMNGKELASRVREKVPGLKVVFMSGYSEQMIADVEGADFLQKPFNHGQLSVKVWSVLGR
jgi:PAS domain S-box-containing protein